MILAVRAARVVAFQSPTVGPAGAPVTRPRAVCRLAAGRSEKPLGAMAGAVLLSFATMSRRAERVVRSDGVDDGSSTVVMTVSRRSTRVVLAMLPWWEDGSLRVAAGRSGNGEQTLHGSVLVMVPRWSLRRRPDGLAIGVRTVAGLLSANPADHQTLTHSPRPPLTGAAAGQFR
jgi:hypothetical protein